MYDKTSHETKTGPGYVSAAVNQLGFGSAVARDAIGGDGAAKLELVLMPGGISQQ